MPSRFWKASGNGLLPGSNMLVVSAIWTPASASIPLAYWYDPSDISTLFKDTAGTTPVTADGDVVALMKDKSGNGNDQVQSTSGMRLVYRTGSGKPYIESANDSVARGMATASGITITDGSGQHSAAAAVMFYDPTGTTSVIDADQIGTNRVSQILRGNGTGIESIAFNSSGSAFTDGGMSITVNVAATLREITSSSAVETWVNGSSNGSTSVTPPMETGAVVLSIMSHNAATDQNLAGRFYGAAGWKGVLGSGDQTASDTYFSGKY